MAYYNPIIVVGPNRSGTSMVAGVLHHLGIHMGFDLMIGEAKENPAGYYEDREVMKLNEDLLFPGSWDRLPPPDYLNLARCDGELKHRVVDFIEARADLGKPWGWKDPRTTATLPIYLPLLQDPKIIICLRHREAAINSLDRREKKKSRSECAFLYDEYMRRLFRNTALTDNFTVNYELFVSSSAFTWHTDDDEVIGVEHEGLQNLVEWLGLYRPTYKLLTAARHIKPELNRSKIDP